MKDWGWIYVTCAGIVEVIYAAAMPKTNGFTRFGPTCFCIIFISLSMYLLSLATKTLPIGTAYAVWVGIGSVGTAAYGIMYLGEDDSPLRILCFILILCGIIGLKLLSTGPKA